MKNYDYFNKEKFINGSKNKENNNDLEDTAFELDYDTFKEEEKKLKADDFNLELDDLKVEENITIDSDTIE